MCGIAGILKLNAPTTSEDIAAVRRMIDAQVHRGPDGEGIVALDASSPSRLPPHALRYLQVHRGPVGYESGAVN